MGSIYNLEITPYKCTSESLVTFIRCNKYSCSVYTGVGTGYICGHEVKRVCQGSGASVCLLLTTGGQGMAGEWGGGGGGGRGGVQYTPSRKHTNPHTHINTHTSTHTYIVEETLRP